ncbi:Conserved_hypothetical protein [Hexamita inflata]|uniref:EGF-like domain-containing protein n=1 Tax=Hexamita inflata TaxID=28002 RepID=A0ABP1JFE5_9EUKA
MNTILSSILIVFKQLNVNSNILCQNSIIVNNNQHLYCQKSNSMNNMKVQNNIYMTQKQNNIQLFIHNDVTQQSVIEVRVYDMEVNTFSLFGLNTNNQIVRDSNISITIDFQVVVGALICIQCDINVYNSTLLFVGSGMQISGVILQALDSFRLQQTFIQFRLTGQNSSGLVNIILTSLTNFSIVDCKLAGSNLLYGYNNGYIASRVKANQSLNISTFKVCVDTTPRFGNISAIIEIIGGDSVECEICGGIKVVYGVCLEDLQHGQLVNGSLQCVDPFQFIDNECVCKYGYLLNGSNCVNILSTIQNMSNNIDSYQIQQINGEIANLANQISALNLSIHNSSDTFNTTQTEQYILKNYTLGDLNLQRNTTVLDQRIYKNISNINENITELKQTINTLNQVIQQQNDVIVEFNCSKTPGNQMLNGTCVQVICPISGQQVVQGRCRCTDVNSYVSGTSCVCPFGSTLLSGVCICDYMHAYVSGTSCVCPTYSSPIGNVCTCPANSQIVGNKCECNQIQGQMMLNGPPPQCSCPANSVPVNDSCVCNVISGQSLQNGVCRCPIGKYMVNTSCVTIDIIEYNDSSIQCSQPIYISTFDITAISKTVGANDFQNGYVFSSSVTSASNMFININNNIYGSVVYPLFQTLTNFINIKIQLGSQVVSTGQLLTGGSQVFVNQMKVISKDGSILTANLGQFSILIESKSHSSSITNLLLNLSFAMSHGNISLINTTNIIYHPNQLNISNYQIIGNYQSIGCISLIQSYSQQESIIVNNVNFKPNTFITGKQSSFFFCTSIQSSMYLNNITIIVGDENNHLLSNIVYSDIYQSYQYGGLVANSTQTSIQIMSIIYDCYQVYKTSYVSNSGLIIGTSLIQSNILILKMCFQQQLSSTTLQFSKFGLIGYNEGNISIQQSSVIFIIQALNIQSFGLVGYQTQAVAKTSLTVLNVTTTINTIILSNISFGNIGGIIGYNNIFTCLIQNVIVNNSNISSANQTGGIVGCSQGYQFGAQTTLFLQNASVQNSIISADNCSAGGIIGYVQFMSLHISSSNIQSVKIFSKLYFGYCIWILLKTCLLN